MGPSQSALNVPEGPIAVMARAMLPEWSSIELQGTAAVAAEGKFARITLAGLTIVCSWLFVNVSFALHYAHECYGEGSDDEVGGLRSLAPATNRTIGTSSIPRSGGADLGCDDYLAQHA